MYSHYSLMKKILKNKKAFYTIKKIFQDLPFLQKLLIVLSFILFYAKASSATKFSNNKKKTKKVFLDIQKFLKTSHCMCKK